ncbi:conserved domain protein [Megasphaera sp. UPII 135-E]|nr:conserved domain protein [Megasphaera sp. UPII 135-E]
MLYNCIKDHDILKKKLFFVSKGIQNYLNQLTKFSFLCYNILYN